MAKTALIVDDSASARLVLGRMLAEQDLAVDTAASGEEAMDYLRQVRPDVIFMDHLMPGMDGFQALEAIKENPATATIPVMMYTSQEGELYVGQARALGAFGVLPKQVEPVEVTKVLRALRLLPEREDESASDAVVVPEIESDRVSELLADLFRQQRSMLRDEIRKGYERLSESSVQTGEHPVVAPPTRVRSSVFTVGTLALVLGVVVFAYLYFETTVLLDAANDRLRLLVESQQQEFGARSVVTPGDDGGASVGDIIEILEWGINQGGSYSFGESALDAGRAQQLAVMADRLGNAGFAGVIAVDVHLGRYCMNLGEDGVLALAPAEQPLESCQQIGWPEPDAVLLGEQQTLPFANMLASASRNEDIRFQISSSGSSEPRVGYPVFTQGLTAGAWNELAARNHRVEVRILSD